MPRALRYGLALMLDAEDTVNIRVALDAYVKDLRRHGCADLADQFAATLAVVRRAERCEIVELAAAPSKERVACPVNIE